MGNVWCCRPNSYIIDYTHRKIVISQGVQCNLLIPAPHYPHICIPRPICTPERHCRCGIYPAASGDGQLSCYRNDVGKKQCLSSPQFHLKPKHQISHNNYIHDHPDALVSLSETFSESSLEEFLTRKRLNQNKNPSHNLEFVNKLNPLNENETFALINSSFNKPSSSLTESLVNSKPSHIMTTKRRNYRKGRTKKRKSIGRKRQLDSSSNNSLSTENSFVDINSEEYKHRSKNDLNNSAETTSNEDSKKTSETGFSLITPRKSILKNCDSIKEDLNETPDSKDNRNSNNSIVVPLDKSLNTSMHSDKCSNGSLPNRSLSAMSNHDSLEQLMSLLKSSSFSATDDGEIKSKKSKSNDCLNKSVNFTKDISDLKHCHEFQPKPITKTGYQVQPDGKIKKRLILRETHKLFDILNDPNDRRIRAICDRYQCDLEIFVRPPKIGLMYFAIEILAPDKYSLRMCVRELDSSMKWCISSQLF